MKKYFLFSILLIITSCSLFDSSKDIELIPFLQKDKYGYFNLEGKIIINPQFAIATAFREDLALVKTTGNNGKWGFIDKDGKFVINAIYKEASVFSEGIAWVVSENSAPVAINKKGDVLFSVKEAEIVRSFKENLAAFSVEDSTSTIWGFIDDTGKQIINPQFVEVGNFSNGKCAVKNKDGKWGYIDKSGKIIINYQFDSAEGFKNGNAVVSLDEKAGVIDEKGKYIINPQFQSIYMDGDKFLIYQDDKVGWCDNDGKFIINPQFESGEIFGESNIASVKSGDKYGYIDTEGKIIINPQFDSASQFFGESAIVKVGDKYGLIDQEGKYIINPQFEEINLDFWTFMYDYSIYGFVSSDYLDVNKIIKVINTDKPENLSLEDNFQSILKKLKKSSNDFSAYSNVHVVFEDKSITKDVSYSFGIMGNLKTFNYYTYDYYVTKEKPEAFVYSLKLSGKALNKAESIQKSFEKTLKKYTLVKKGYIEDSYTSVYKSNKNIVITSNKDSDKVIIYILNKDFDTTFYLNKISEKNKAKNFNDSVDDDENQYSPYADTTAVESVDTTAVEY